MLPPGLSFNAISEKARQAARNGKSARSFWDWEEMLAANTKGYFPYTPSTNLLQGLNVAIELLHAEGLDAVFDRHKRAAEATRRAVQHWGFEIQCRNPVEYSPSLTAVRLPGGHSADRLRATILARCDISLGNGLGPLADKVFRIGHLGDSNDTSVAGTLSGIEMGLRICGIPHRSGGVEVAIEYMAGNGAPLPA
jgi:alanine-glyoxylate transaminase/serine-glyoxylate transaminase/serine-pyruvate transaminase